MKVPKVRLDGGIKGTVYWINLMPPCINSQDPVCNQISQQYFVSNTTQQTNGFRAILQPAGGGIIDAHNQEYQYNWEGLCFAGFRGCDYVSFGLMGRVVQ